MLSVAVVGGGLCGLALARVLTERGLDIRVFEARNVCLRDDHVELHFTCGERPVIERARRVVLAMPPRLIAENVQFEPALPDDVQAALIATPTWMAAHAKAVLSYDRAFWRMAGQSGNAFVRHEQATLTEVFDACDTTGLKAALGGFLALSPSQRKDFHFGLPMLMGNQMTQLFGATLHENMQLYQDWANEPYTCSARDREAFSTSTEHPSYDTALLHEPLWNGALYFGGSETADQCPGYLEGALDAAHRIQDQLPSTAEIPADSGEPTAASDTAVASSTSENGAHIEQFATWVRSQQESAFERYRQHLNASLATQQREQLTQRAVLDAMEQMFGDALERLAELPFNRADVPVEHGCSALTPQVQRAFHGFIDRLMHDVARFNRTSCALSNFPDEHRISHEYEQTMLRDIAAAWREFCLSANSILLGHLPQLPTRAARPGLTSDRSAP